MVKDKSILLNIIKQAGPTVFLPNNDYISSNASGNLPIPSLSTDATKTHLLPGLQNSSLLSLGQICDDDCIVHLTKSHLYVFKNNKLLLTGFRNQRDGLWDVPLPQQRLITPSSPSYPHHSANVIIKKETSKRDLAQYLHACAFSPCVRTFLTAITKGNFITWPGLTPTLIKKHLPPSMFTAKGHMNQENKNLQSTKKSYKAALLQQPSNHNPSLVSYHIENDFHPHRHDMNTPKTHNCFITICHPSQNQKTGFLDLTGRFPYRSSRGNQYILTVYDYDSNAILVKAIKNRQAETITNAWKSIVAKLEKQNIQPTIFIMDNEASEDLKIAMKSSNYNFQLVPPENHQKKLRNRQFKPSKIIS